MTELHTIHKHHSHLHHKKQHTAWNEAISILKENGIPATNKNTRLVTLLLADNLGIYDFTKLTSIPQKKLNSNQIKGPSGLFDADGKNTNNTDYLEKLATYLGDKQNGIRKHPHPLFDKVKKHNGLIDLSANEVKSLSALIKKIGNSVMYQQSKGQNVPNPAWVNNLSVPQTIDPLLLDIKPVKWDFLAETPKPLNSNKTAPTGNTAKTVPAHIATQAIVDLYRTAPHGNYIVPDETFNVVKLGDDYWCPFGDGQPSKQNKICFFDTWGDRLIKLAFQPKP